MKRWSFFALIVFLTSVICLISLFSTVRDPADYSGKWYYHADGSAYLFHNGIIISEKHHVPEDNGEIFSGAYCFGKKKIVLFFVHGDGIEQVRELILVRQNGMDTLCDCEGDKISPVFYRNKDALKFK